MASLVKRKNGTRELQFWFSGKRRTFRLGRMKSKEAQLVRFHVESLVSSRERNVETSKATTEWLSSGCGPKMRLRLENAGLLGRREQPTLGELRDYVDAQYRNGNRHTHRNLMSAISTAIDYFSASMLLADITQGDAKDLQRALLQQGYAPTTTSECLRKLRRCFRMAVDKKWVEQNPFHHMSGLVATNPDRQVFVSRDTVERLIASVEPEWQLIIALARYGGLRCPSEVMDLEWSWVDLPASTMKVFSRKNQRYEAKRWREVPIFPELRSPLERAWDLAPVGAKFVIQGHRQGERSLYSALQKRLKKTAIAPWPKLFVNLRSSRETELVEEYPLHVVTSWLGNSPEIAAKHYLQVTAGHFSRAIGCEGSEEQGTRRRDVHKAR